MSAERVPMRLVPVPAPAASLESWLDEVQLSLRGPAGVVGEIREELESHLHERVRDLELGGLREGDAVRRALAELGDAGALARRYDEARRLPRRRLLMNLSMFAVSGALLAVGVVAVSRPDGDLRVSVFERPAPSAQNEALFQRHFDLNVREVALRDTFEFLGKAAGVPLSVSWASLGDVAIEPDTPVTLVEPNTDLGTALHLLSDQLGAGAWALGYRVQDGRVRVATESYFDKQEVVLASYELGEYAGDGERVVHLVQDFVHPSGWVDNGGDLAKSTVVGSKMFVEAPRRYHVQIEWFLKELRSGDAGAGAGVNTRELQARADQASIALVAERDRQAQVQAMLDQTMADAKRLKNENDEMNRRMLSLEQNRQQFEVERAMRDEATKRMVDAANNDSAALRDQLSESRKQADGLQRECVKQQVRADMLAKTMDQQAVDLKQQIDSLRAELDQLRRAKQTKGTEVQVIPVKHVVADQLAVILSERAKQIPGLERVMADARTNSLVLQGDRAAIESAEDLLKALDRPAEPKSGAPGAADVPGVGAPGSK